MIRKTLRSRLADSRGSFSILAVLSSLVAMASVSVLMTSLSSNTKQHVVAQMNSVNNIEGFHTSEIVSWYAYEANQIGAMPAGSSGNPNLDSSQRNLLSALAPTAYQGDSYTQGGPLNGALTRTLDSMDPLLPRVHASTLTAQVPADPASGAFCGVTAYPGGFREGVSSCLYTGYYNGTGTMSPLVTGYATSLVLQPNGAILVGGIGYQCTAITCSAFTAYGFLVRYLHDGRLDTSFNGTGLKRVDFPSYALSSVKHLSVQPDRKILVHGDRYATTVSTAEDYMTRLNYDGSTDLSFGTGGVIDPLAAGYGWSSILHPSGNIYVAGSDLSTSLIIARYSSSGALIAQTSMTSLDFPGGPAGSAEARSISLVPDGSGRMLVAGFVSKVSGSTCGGVPIGREYYPAWVRMFPDLSLDLSFNSPNGRKVLLSTGYEPVINLATYSGIKVAVDNLGGSYASFNSPTLGASVCVPSAPIVIRLDAGGNLDPGFNGTGISSLPISFVSNSYYHESGVILQNSGLPIIAGRFFEGKPGAFIASYAASGTLDSSFNPSGVPEKAYPNLDLSPGISVNPGIIKKPFLDYSFYGALAADPDGKFTAAGGILRHNRVPGYSLLVSRYLPDGSPDPTFAR